MKHIYLLSLCFFAVSVWSQTTTNKVSVNPIQLLGYNRLNIEYERTYNEGKTGIFFYLGQTGNASRLIHDQYSSLSEQNAGIRIYHGGSDRSGFWYGGLLSVSSGTILDKNREPCISGIGALGILGTGGYQFIMKGFYLSVYLNPGVSLTHDLFGSAIFADGSDKPGKLLLTYGLKTGICF